jgi:predicted transposase YbfD/YdcC
MLILIQLLKKVKDCRRSQGKRHPLWLILLLVILGTMMGYMGYRAWARFGQTEGPFIAQALKIKCTQWPSDSTIKRALIRINFDNLINIFHKWMRELNIDKRLSEGVCIDGKNINSTLVNQQSSEPNCVNIVSCFSQVTGLVLQLSKFESKSGSEIHQVLEMLRDSTDSNQLFTRDALHCQKATVELITTQGNDYIIPVKKNQKNLYKETEKVCQSQPAKSIDIQWDKGHGRQVTRQVSVFEYLPNNNLKGWESIKSLIKVERSGYRGGKIYQQTMYYISSLSKDASFFAAKIRGHWSIENQLHWVKDVILGEDTWPIRQFQAATNVSVLRTMALNLWRMLGFLSVTDAYKCLGKRVERYLFLLE